LRSANRATLEHDGRVTLVLEPGDAGEVARCVEIARHAALPLRVVSLGRNWGYGSRLPRSGNAILLSLRRLDRVIVDEGAGIALVEPGVTFGRLAEMLTNSAFLAPSIGAGPNTSVLGNCLERGLAKPPYAEMVSQLAGLEALLPNGVFVRTGVLASEADGMGAAIPPGPDLTGLFTQAHIGIVLRAAIRLLPAPAFRQESWTRVEGAEGLANLIEASRPLLRSRDDRLQIELLNDVRLAMHERRRGPMPMVHAGWTMALTGWADSLEELEGLRRRIEARLGGPRSLDSGPPEAGSPARRNAVGLGPAYWAMGEMPRDPDPDRDGCGLIWFTPVLPLDGIVVSDALAAAGRILAEHGFAQAVSLRGGHEGALKAVIGIFYDRAEPGADQRARAAHQTLEAEFTRRGHRPYRLSVLTPRDRWQDAGTTALVQALARWSDPAGILGDARQLL
jgi:4-cresol dehydrogenase (hydroxylating)